MALIKRCSEVARLLTMALLLSSFSLLAGTKADELIGQVQKRYNGAQTLTVHFVETYSVLGHPRPSEWGTLTLRKQGKMRWDYDQPKGKLFISDGKNVYLYTAKDNRVEKVPLKDTEDMRAPLAFLLGRLDMKKEFRDFQVRSADDGIWLDAGARNDRVPYSTVEMLLAPEGSIRQLRVLGRDESVIAFSFSEERLNPAVSNDLFHFDVPPGAEVVDSMATALQEK